LRIEICLYCTCNMLENKCTVPQAYGERENMDHMFVWGWCCTAKHVANTCARSPLSSFIILRTGGNRQSSFASGCLASRRASGSTTACAPLPQLFIFWWKSSLRISADRISFWSLRIQISTEQQCAWTVNRYFEKTCLVHSAGWMSPSSKATLYIVLRD